MTFEQFMIEWNGKYCEVAGSANARNQCVDLVNAYIRDVLKLPIIEWTNAVDFPSKAGDKYEWIPNTPTNIAMRGDIIIWNGAIGHIAIVIEANVNNFKSFDQNYPVGSPCHVQNHTYANVKGWLRAKKAPESPSAPQPVFTNQTKIPININTQLEMYGEIQLDTLRDKLNAKDSALVNANKTLELYVEKTEELLIDVEKAKKDLAAYVEQNPQLPQPSFTIAGYNVYFVKASE